MKRSARRARLMARARFGIAGTIALLCMASTVRAQTPISGLKAWASSTETVSANADRHPIHAVDGSGLYDSGGNTAHRAFTWASSPNNAIDWMTPNGKQIGEWLTVGLKGIYDLTSIKVWNLNEDTRGTQMADIYVSTNGVGSPISNPSDWTKVKEDQTFNRAPYADGYTAADTVTFSAQARYVSFVVEHYYGDGGVDVGDFWGQTHAGFSEIQLFGTAVGEERSRTLISGVTATASSTETWNPGGGFDRSPIHAVNGDGLNNGLHDYFEWWDSARNHNDWCTAAVTPSDQWFKADLGSKKNLDLMEIWNCNEVAGYTTRGVKQFDVYVSDTGTGTPGSHPGEWTLVRADVIISQGNNGVEGEFPAGFVDLLGYSGRYVLIDVDSNYGDGDHVSIAEVQFFETTLPLGTVFRVR